MVILPSNLSSSGRRSKLDSTGGGTGGGTGGKAALDLEYSRAFYFKIVISFLTESALKRICV